MTADQVGGIVRAILAGIGGYFVSKGVIDESTVTTIVGGLATVITAVWSVWSKKKDA